MTASEAAEVKRLVRCYNQLVLSSLRSLEGINHPVIEVVSKVSGQNQLGLQWRPFMEEDGRLLGDKLTEISL